MRLRGRIVSVEYKQVVSVEPKIIAVGDRVLFTNPSTGQQLIGTVVGHDPEHRLDREWRVKFDSWMFRDVDTRTAHVAAVDLVHLPKELHGRLVNVHDRWCPLAWTESAFAQGNCEERA